MSNPDPALTALALLYTHGEMEAVEAGAFESRLGVDQAAREALCQAVQLTRTLGGQPAAAPHAGYRERVREQLLPNAVGRVNPALPASVRTSWWSAIVGRRAYRGHPALWALTGALAAVLLVVICLPRRSPGSAASPEQPIPERMAELPPARGTWESQTPHPQVEPEPDPTSEMAQVWAELHTSEHLIRVHAEEQRRRHRAEERGGRGSTH